MAGIVQGERRTIRRVPKWGVAVALFVGVWLCYLPGNLGCADSMWSVPTAVSLIDERNPDLDEHLPVLRARRFVFTQQVRGHFYTIYPFGTSIVAAPAVVLLRPVAAAVRRLAPSTWEWLAREQAARGCPPVDDEPVIALHSWTEHLIASAIVAATAVVLFFIAARETTVGAAIAIALVFAFGTPAWSSASRSLWQHGPSMLLLALALLVQQRGGRMLWVGLLLAAAYVVRPTNAIPLAGAAAWVLLAKPRQLPTFLLGAATVLALFVWSNTRIYGAWLPPYYRPGFYSPNAFKGEALAGLLVGPSRGLFVFSPILLLSFAGVAIKAAARRLTLLDLSIAGAVVLHWVVISTTNGNWWGGDSYGPRLFTDLVPYLVYLALPVVGWMAAAPGIRRPAAAAAVAALAAISVAMHAQGALNPATMAWNALPTSLDFDPSRLWDWKQPQFLAGITFTPAAIPPVDLGIIACSEPPGVPGPTMIEENRARTVVLRWAPAPGRVAVYIIEVGSRPGLNDEPSREARDVFHPSVVAHHVPPGTYYVRVHGRNRCGDGPSSPEIAVTVQ
jgi:hypothetical protein